MKKNNKTKQTKGHNSCSKSLNKKTAKKSDRFDRKKALMMGLVSVFAIAFVSVGTYAIWNAGDGLITDKSSISTGQIKMSYTEINEVTMENALPMKDEEGKVIDDYFDFQVLTYMKTNEDDNTERRLSYDITVEPLDIENPLSDKDIKVYLTRIDNGVETEVEAPTTIDKLVDKIVSTQEEVFSNNKGEVITSYRLRAWVDEEVDPARFTEKKYSYKFRVDINGEQYVHDYVNLMYIKRPDKSGANVPKLTSNMIPVYYDTETDVWRKADANNVKSNWYNYDKKKWANAVTVSNVGNYKTVTSKTDLAVSIDSEVSEYKVESVTQGGYWLPRTKIDGVTGIKSCCSSYYPDNMGSYFKMKNATYTLNTGLSKGLYCMDIEARNVSGSCSSTGSRVYKITATTNFGTTSYEKFHAYYYTIVPTYSPSKYKIGSSYSLNSTTGKFTLSGVRTVTYSSSYANYYMCTDKTSTTCDSIYKIKTVSGTKVTKVDQYVAEKSLNTTSSADYEVGDEIPMSKISTMWTWIPRYKYTYFNTNTPEEINITFEKGTESTGTITCNNSISGSGSVSESCSDSKNGGLKTGVSTYTHPAFNFGGTQLTGIWVGKFENSATLVQNENSTIDSTIVIKPDVPSLRYKAASYMFKDARMMEKANNPYGFPQNTSTSFNWNGNLTNDNNNLDTHMMKNSEWGAVAYLSHSKYGINKEININNSSLYYTGRSGGDVGGSTQINKTYPDQTSTSLYNQYGYYTYDGYLLNYNTNTKSETRDMNKVASTTGNIYGVYDMSGGAYEYVMGNMVNSSNQFQPSSSVNWTTSTYPLAKYYDSYTYNTSNTQYTRGKLGDATKEMAPTGVSGHWYKDNAYFPYSSSSWFYRGGSYNYGTSAGAFNFNYNGGSYGSNISSRTTLTIQ